MNFEASTQHKYWYYPSANWRSDKEQQLFQDCIWFIHELEPQCGLASSRKAFVTAAHYFHRYFSVHSIEDAPMESQNSFSPKNRHAARMVAFTCLFISGKTEEVPWPKYTHGSLQCRGYRADRMCAAVHGSITLEKLMECERDVLETLGFCLVVHQTIPRPLPGSDDEKRETILLMNSKFCLSKTPEEFGEALKTVDLQAFGFPVPLQMPIEL
jgi:hypothetical protein